jgi:hypothetical protein
VYPGTVILLTSPLGPPDYWADLAAGLRAHGMACAVPEVPLVDGHPAAAGPWIVQTAQQLHRAEPAGPLTFVAQGAAGALTPALARTQRAARRAVRGYVFVDATLPRPSRPPTHLDLLRAADPAAADHLHAALHGNGHVPGDEPLPGNHDFWTETLPMVSDWPDAPCVYLPVDTTSVETGPTTWWARSAAARGWFVDEADGRPVVERLVDSIHRLGD